MSGNEEKQPSQADPEAMSEVQTDEEAIAQVGRVQSRRGELVQDQAELEKLVGDDAALTLVVEIHDKEVLVHTNEQTIVCPFADIHLIEFRRGYQSGLDRHAAGEEALIDKNLIKHLKELATRGTSESVGLMQWHIGRLLGQMDAGNQNRDEMAVANEVLRRAVEVVTRAQRDLEEVREVATRYRQSHDKKMQHLRWVKAPRLDAECLYVFERVQGKVMIKRLGKRTHMELVELLEHGYFECGRQRIMQMRGSSVTDKMYILWEDWDNQIRDGGANDLMTLIKGDKIPIEKWSWISVPPPEDLPR
jgi:hypothetical protein